MAAEAHAVDSATNNVGSSSEESYVLPHDTSEYQRLDRQSNAIWKLMGGRHIHAPVSKDASLLLDIGCGFGNVSKSLAADHPQAKVIGVDLAPVPSSGKLPSNLSFVQGNVLEVAGQHPQLQHNSADLVFSRLLIAGLKGGLWPAYVKALYNLLKPGGRIDMADIAMQGFECTDPTDPIRTKKRVPSENLDSLREIGIELGFDFECGAHLAQYMEDAGFIDIQVHEYPWAFGTWLEKHYAPAEGFQFEGQAEGLAAPLSQMYKAKFTEAEVEAKRRQLEDFLKNSPNQFMILYAVSARKPIQQ